MSVVSIIDGGLVCVNEGAVYSWQSSGYDVVAFRF